MNLRRNLVTLFLLLFIFIPKVKAGVTLDNKTLDINQSGTIDLKVSGTIQSIGGTIKSSDENCVKITSITGLKFKTAEDEYETTKVTPNVNKFAFYLTDVVNLNTAIVRIGISSLKECNTTIVVENGVISNGISEDPFSAEGKVTVKKNEVNEIINNNQQKNNDTNSVNVVQKKEQNTKVVDTNTIIQNNNKVALNEVDLTLSSLNVDGYNINFNKNQLDYFLEVENDVEKLNIAAKAAYNNSNVNIEGNDNLLVGENLVKIIVSNNNDQKVYTIKVNKKQNPDKTYNTDNYLVDIKPSVGILSPKFDKEILNYVIYLPYEIDNISFETTKSSETSIVDVLGPDILKIGDNRYVIKVRAESGDIREYNILIKKENIYNNSNNNYLKNIILTNGKLNIDFNKDIMTYYYTRKDGFKYDFELDDPNSNVEVYENEGTITIVVEAPNGEKRVYTLIEKKNNIIKYLLMVFLSTIMGYLIKCLIIELKKNKKRKKKKQIEMK